MDLEGSAYLGNGDWLEVFHQKPPVSGQHVDIPLRDVTPMVVEVLRRDLLPPSQAALIVDAAEDSLLRQARE